MFSGEGLSRLRLETRTIGRERRERNERRERREEAPPQPSSRVRGRQCTPSVAIYFLLLSPSSLSLGCGAFGGFGGGARVDVTAPVEPCGSFYVSPILPGNPEASVYSVASPPSPGPPCPLLPSQPRPRPSPPRDVYIYIYIYIYCCCCQ